MSVSRAQVLQKARMSLQKGEFTNTVKTNTIQKSKPQWPLCFECSMSPQTMCPNGDSNCREESKERRHKNVLPLDFTNGKEIHWVECSHVKSTDDEDVAPDDFIPGKGVGHLVDDCVRVGVHLGLQLFHLFICNQFFVTQIHSINTVCPLCQLMRSYRCHDCKVLQVLLGRRETVKLPQCRPLAQLLDLLSLLYKTRKIGKSNCTQKEHLE